MARMPEMVSVLLGILNCGACYVPLDPGQPVARLRAMIGAAGVRCIVTHGLLIERARTLCDDVVAIDADGYVALAERRVASSGRRSNREPPPISPAQLAYIMFTSGSTGVPKGVMVEHGAVVNRLSWMIENGLLSAKDRVLLRTPYSFDASVWEIFTPLVVGARLCIAGPEDHRDPAAHVALIRRWDVSVIQTVPSFLALLLDEPGIEDCRSLNKVFFGGEPAPAALLEKMRRLQATFYNLYGPTETTIDVTCWKAGDGPHGAILPIGRPNANVRIDILDAKLRQVPPGVAGEIVVSGPCLARGYVGCPAEEKRRFVRLSAELGGVRAYRTGDLGVQRPDGILEFVGRADRQVKLAGIRIELAEIENVLLRYPGIRQAAVSTRDMGARKRVVAYVVAEALEREALHRFLVARLEPRAIPAFVVTVPELPRTASGKIDVAALPLPLPAHGVGRQACGAAPRGDLECRLAEIWQQCFGLDEVGRDEKFLDLGGDSLTAIRLLRDVRDTLGATLSVAELLQCGDIGRLARAIERQSGLIADNAHSADVKVGTLRRDPSRWRLAPAQEGLWFDIERFGAGHDARYNMGQAVRIRGAFDGARLEHALNCVVARHECLRSTILVENGEPFACVEQAPRLSLPVELVTASEIPQRIAAEMKQPFLLAQEPPLRVRLLRVTKDDHVLIITVHHIAADDRTLDLLRHELVAAYRGHGALPDANAKRIDYGDFAVWHRSWAASPPASAATERWRHYLTGASGGLGWLGGRASLDCGAEQVGAVQVELSPAVCAKLRSVSRSLNVTEFMILLAALGEVISAYTRSRDVIIGVPASMRTEPELDDVIGYCINLLPVRLDLTEAADFRGLVARACSALDAALADRRVPLPTIAHVASGQNVGGAPLIQVAFSYQTRRIEWEDFDDASVETIEVPMARARFALEIQLLRTGERITGQVIYDPVSISAAAASGIAAAFSALLEFGLSNLSAGTAQLPFLNEKARHVLVQRVQDALAGPDQVASLGHRLRQHRSDSIAIVYEGRGLTYADVLTRAAGLASRLRSYLDDRNGRIVVCLPRSPEQVISQLAVAIAGAAFVALDAALPPARLRRMASQVEAVAIITDGAHADAFGAGIPILDIGSERPLADAVELLAIAETVAASDPAYVVFTSGSSGEPKAVVVPYCGLDNLIAWHCDNFSLTSADRCTRLAGCGFDAAIWETWPCLCAGATLVIAAQENLRSPDAIRDWLSAERISVSFLPTPLAESMLDLDWSAASHLRLVLTGGDRLTRRPTLGAPFRLVNNYGPSECSVVATSGLVTPRDQSSGVPDIGRPLRGHAMFVLDAQGRVLPTGAVGELAIGGRGLAAGYYGRPDLTAQAFPELELIPGSTIRVYRTGDLCRARSDGCFEFLGRTDQQIKVRGHRIEPGEVEAVLAADASVGASAAVPAAGGLAAFVTAKPGAEVDVEDVRRRAAQLLPSYMVPATITVIAQLPLTANGKIDRAALILRASKPRAEIANATADSDFSGKAADVIAAEMASLLGVSSVDPSRSFFEQGGDSLTAMKLLARLEARFMRRFPLAKIFEHSTVEKLSALVAEPGSSAPPVALVPDAYPDQAPLSPAQLGIYAMLAVNGDRVRYNAFVAWRIRGALDVAALTRAFHVVVCRHQALRTVFEATANGDVVQRTVLALHPLVRVAQIAPEQDAISNFVNTATLQTFNLQQGPLIALDVAKLGPGDHVVVITVHHLVSDGQSIAILLAEISRLYDGDATRLPQPPLGHLAYARAAVSRLSMSRSRRQEAYWRRVLQDAPAEINLSVARLRPRERSFEGRSHRFQLSASTVSRLSELGATWGATLYATLLAGFVQALSRLGAGDDLVVGVPMADRAEAGFADTVGLFVSLLPIRCRAAADGEAASSVIRRTGERLRGALSHAALPFDRLLRAAGIATTLDVPPLCQVLFVMPDQRALELPLIGADAARLYPTRLSVKFDLTLVAQLTKEGGLDCVLEYSVDLYDETAARAVAEATEAIWRALATDASCSAADLPTVLPQTRDRLLGPLSKGTERYAPAVVVSAALRRFEHEPRRAAVTDRSETIDRGTLESRSRRLAVALLRRGVRRGDRIGLCLSPGVDVVVAVLATWRAGAAYVPLDPNDPPRRHADTLADLKPRLLLVDGQTGRRMEKVSVPAFDLGVLETAGDDVHDARIDCAEPGDLAYVVMTSGSTGRPKGVLIEHGSLASVAAEQNERFAVTADSRILQFVSLSFDVAACDIAMGLMAGAVLCVVDRTLAPGGSALAELMRRERITHAQIPAPVLATVPEADLPDLAVLVCGGDVCDRDLAQRWSARRRFFNAYGPTEATVCATLHEWEDIAADPPIGRPLAHVDAYVLDEAGRLLPIGVPGELCLAGPGLARGYWKRKALTTERFVVHSIAGQPPRRMYRTGDLALFQQDGKLRFLGRLDGQVKIRGHRIETEEVAAAVRRHPMVAQAVVVALGDRPERRELAAYVVPRHSAPLDVAAILRDLRELLPPAMQPSHIVSLSALPLNANGKIDVWKLPKPYPLQKQATHSPEHSSKYPDGAKPVDTILSIWRDILACPGLGPDDDFFRNGGQSLLASVAVGRMSAALGTELSVRSIFERPTARTFARALQISGARPLQHAGSQTDGARPVADGPVRPSHGQEEMWAIHATGQAEMAYVVPAAFTIEGELDCSALRAALALVVARHDALRSRLRVAAGRLTVAIDAAHAVELDRAEMTDREIGPWLKAEMHRPFDVESSPLYRFKLRRLGPRSHVLLLVFHHLIVDGWSMGILFREITAAYSGFITGRHPQFEAAPSYREFARDQRSRLDHAAKDHIAFWLKYLSGSSEQLLPERGDSSAREPRTGATLPIAIAAPTLKALTTRLQRQGTRATTFVALEACLGLALGRIAGGRRDLVVATDVANRSRAETERLVGLVVNQIPLRIRFSPIEPINSLLARLDGELRDAVEHAELPFGQIVRALNPDRRFGRMPLVRAKLVMEPRVAPLSLGSARLTELAAESGESKFDLLVSLAETECDGLTGRVEYRADLLDERTVRAVSLALEAAMTSVADGAMNVTAVEHAIDAALGNACYSGAARFEAVRSSRLAALRGRRRRAEVIPDRTDGSTNFNDSVGSS